MRKALAIFTSEMFLGLLVVLLSLMTAYSGYDGSMSDSKQNEFEIKAQKELMNASAEYLTANQLIIYDYQLFDGAYTNDDAEKVAYYEESYSQALTDSIARTPDDPFSDAYYDEIYADANTMFEMADEYFVVAAQFDARSDALQLVLLVSALGLALVAWASLLREESVIRLLFAGVGVLIFVYTVVLYFAAPNAVAPI